MYILAESRKIVNRFVECINGFKEQRVFYTDTDSIYIRESDFEILRQNNLVGDDLG